MSQTPIKKFEINKNEQKQNLILLIGGGVIALASLIMFLVCNSSANNLKNTLAYLFNPSEFEAEMQMYKACSTIGIILFVISLVYLLVSVLSFILLRSASLSVYDDHIAGRAGIHWNGFCFGTKETTIACSEIASVGVHKIKALQNRYVIVTTKDAKKHTFAVNDVEEAIALIQSHLTRE